MSALCETETVGFSAKTGISPGSIYIHVTPDYGERQLLPSPGLQVSCGCSPCSPCTLVEWLGLSEKDGELMSWQAWMAWSWDSHGWAQPRVGFLALIYLY